MNNNEETFDLESILAKLSDLQHLANNAGTEGEAAAAAAAVQRLLFKYNLSMADIGEKGEAGRAFERSDFTIGGDLNASTNKWKAHLLAVICAANFCGCVQRGSSRTRWSSADEEPEPNATVVGRPANIPVALGMFEYLEKEARRQCNVAYKKYGRFLLDTPRGRFNRSFYFGFIDVVRERLAAQRRNSVAEAGTRGSALVEQSDKEVAAAVAKFFPYVRDVRHRATHVDTEVLTLGRKAGSNVNLDKQVGEQSGPPMLKP